MKTIVILGSALIASAAAAQTPAAPAPASDQSERICVTRNEIGTRLGRVRVCATRAQWEADRQSARATAEHGQANQVNPTLMTPGERAGVTGRYYVGPAREPR